jgi:hypothetical protein
MACPQSSAVRGRREEVRDDLWRTSGGGQSLLLEAAGVLFVPEVPAVPDEEGFASDEVVDPFDSEELDDPDALEEPEDPDELEAPDDPDDPDDE